MPRSWMRWVNGRLLVDRTTSEQLKRDARIGSRIVIAAVAITMIAASIAFLGV